MHSSSLAPHVLRLRLWQLQVNEELKQGRFRVPVHLAIGHEAVAVAVCSSMLAGDQMALTHRNIAYNLARIGALKPVLDEYDLSPGGVSRGWLGSMNLANPARGVIYTSSILGNNLPVACGLALAQKVKGSEAAVWALTGDGAMEEGAFYESLLFARSHALPMVFVIENNDHSLASRIHERRSAIDAPMLSASLGVPAATLKGNDADEYAATLAGLRRQTPGGPVLIEAHVTLFSNHAGATPGWPADPKSIRLKDGLVVDPSQRDPAWVAKRTLESAGLAALLSQLQEEHGCPAILPR